MPKKFIVRANEILALQDAALASGNPGADGVVPEAGRAARTAATQRLVRGASSFKRDVENATRKEERRGGLTRRPKGQEEVLRSAVPVLTDIRDYLQELVEIQRARVGSPATHHRCDSERLTIP